MQTPPNLSQTAWLTLLFGIAAFAAPPDVRGQDEKPAPVVEEQDLGDGFRAVSVNGGPPAIIDDETGLILKLINGRPAVVDQEAGVILYSNDEGEPTLKNYRGRGKGNAKSPEQAKLGSRMKAYMKRAQAQRQAYMKRSKARGKAARGSKKKRHLAKPRLTLEARVALYLKLLQVGGDEAAVLQPILKAILVKQNQIQRSTLDELHLQLALGVKFLKPIEKVRRDDLPAAVQRFLEGFPAGKGRRTPAQLEKGLAEFREARRRQDAKLRDLRDKLRELLTVVQEAKLAAVGLLD